MPSLDWDDLRHALAIGAAGSLAGASRTLGVNHTTVLRRLDALEAHLGSRLFDRQRRGYQPTEAGLALLEQARQALASVQSLTDQLGRVADPQQVALILRDAQVTTQNLRRFSQQGEAVMSSIERGEGTLGMLVQDDSLYLETRQSVREFKELVRDIRANPKKYINLKVF
jgi:DNA-binding transcriptional LysR family regulator